MVPRSTQVIEPKVKAIIFGHGRGWVFSRRDFAHIGDPNAIGMALLRLTRKGVIRQLARGLFDYPMEHPALGVVAPSADAVAKALASRDAVRLQPTGAYAANVIGLSEQVPTKIIFLTDGPGRHVKIGNREIILKRTTPRNLATAGRKSGTVIQALRYLGKDQVTDRVLSTIRRLLDDSDKAQLLKDIKYAPGWVGGILRQLGTATP